MLCMVTIFIFLESHALFLVTLAGDTCACSVVVDVLLQLPHGCH